MKGNKSKNIFFDEILLKNNEEELKEFLLSKGKNPKPICPVQFIKNDENVEV